MFGLTMEQVLDVHGTMVVTRDDEVMEVDCKSDLRLAIDLVNYYSVF